MANDSIDHYKVLSEIDLFSLMSKTDHSSISGKKILFNNSKSLRTSPSNLSIDEHFHTINVNQMLKTQNNNAPWLFNILTKKFHRTKRRLSREIDEQFLAKQMSKDGSSGCWIIHEKENSILPLASLSDADDSLRLHHYHYEFPSTETPVIDDFSSITSMIKSHYSKRGQLTKSNDIEDLPTMMTEIGRVQRAKSASASRREHRKKTSTSTTKRTNKYYQQRLLTSEEMQLRESLRLIDLDNIGFFSPNQLHKVLKDIGLHSQQIETIQRCLPIDDDGHYSLDNLVKLLLP